jgi:hypothetical protein
MTVPAMMPAVWMSWSRAVCHAMVKLARSGSVPVISTIDSSGQPGGYILVPCGNRREAICPAALAAV